MQLRGGGVDVLTGTASNQRPCFIRSFMIRIEIQVNKFFSFSLKVSPRHIEHRVFPLAAAPHPVSTPASVSTANRRSILNPLT